MSESIYELFSKVVKQVFNNWTALQLAVEQEMGGPESHSTALEVMNWITTYCIDNPHVDVNDLTETLTDILDEEYDTICEDNSPKVVSQVLMKFLQYLKEGNLQQFELEFNNLPICKIWLSHREVPLPKVQSQVEEDEESSDQNEMDVDPEWTVVHNRRKK